MFKDLTGKRYGKLAIIKLAYIKNYRSFWECKCDCGNICIVNSHNLGKHTNSCGCIALERIKNLNRKHDGRKSRLYNIWCAMKERTENQNNPAYKDYGGRGITICFVWKNDFTIFRDWAVANGYKDNLTIDRRDNNGNYEPKNCRWADRKTQNRNRRTTKYIEYNGEKHCIQDWSILLGGSHGLVSRRLKKGWGEFAAVSTPVGRLK
jgi:hypothetical protein